MKEQLTRYVDLLFAGAPQATDIKQEILQNTLDRYDDLIEQGKTPQAAYQLAISGIGDINELLGCEAPSFTTSQPAQTVSEPSEKATPAWKKVLRAVGICLYIMCPIPLFVLQDAAGLCGLLTFVAVATALMFISGGKENKKEAAQDNVTTPQSELRKAVNAITWAIGLCTYFALSFTLQAWYITWVIFPLTAAAQGLILACMDIKGAKNNAIARIVIFSLVILLLLGILGVGLGVGMFAFSIDTDFGSYNTIEGSEGSVPATDINKLQIEWVDGSIDIRTADVDTISFCESGYAPEDKQMVWQQNGDTLTIRYSKPYLQIGFVSMPTKDLQIIIPEDWFCDELDIETVSGSVSINGLNADEIEFDCTSAECEFIDCIAQEVSLTTVSGDLFYSGTLDSLSCDGVSAKCTAELYGAARHIEMDCVSGDLIITIPDSMGFSAAINSLSGEVSTQFTTTMSGNRYIYGDGSCHIEADTLSGDIIIKKAN